MKKNLKDFTRKKQMYGRMFILPWEIGFILFFAQPLLQSLILVFSDVDSTSSTCCSNSGSNSSSSSRCSCICIKCSRNDFSNATSSRSTTVCRSC